MDSKTKYLKNGEFSYHTETGLLGKGAFGSVYKGLITSTNQVVAIKALSLQLLKQYGEQIKEIMKNQVAVMKDLSNHMLKYPCPFIVKIYDCFLTENNIYLVLEFCDAGDLSGDLAKRKRIPEGEAKVIIYQIVRALDFIADLGVIHRDLKPDNIFKQKTQCGSIYKLGDFGLAVAAKNETQTAGTAPYMAPEMIRGDEYGIEIDIFSLGCVAHEILFGDIYFIANTEEEVRQLVLKKEYKIKVPGLVSNEMADFLQKCMKKDKRERIKHKELRKHPVFRELEQNYSAMFGALEQGSRVVQQVQNNYNQSQFQNQYQQQQQQPMSLSQSQQYYEDSLNASSSSSSRNYNPHYTIKFQQSSKISPISPPVPSTPSLKWRLNNEVHKAIFLQQVGRRLLHIQRQNSISIYLIKDALYRLNKIRQSCKTKHNFLSFPPQLWNEFCSSKQFPIFYQVLTQALMHSVNIYETEYQVFMNYLANYSKEQKEAALRRLGAGKDQNVDEGVMFQELYAWTQGLAQREDEESKILAQECILAIKINEIEFDFTEHLKEREKLSSQVLFERIKTLG